MKLAVAMTSYLSASLEILIGRIKSAAAARGESSFSVTTMSFAFFCFTAARNYHDRIIFLDATQAAMNSL